MPNISLADILAINGTKLVFEGKKKVITSLHFDSRKIELGMGFLARKGKLLDGHNYIDAAIKQGANLIIAQREVLVPKHISLILHKDPFILLQELASNYRQKLKGTVIGITGSVGKTSTKESLKVLLGNQAYSSVANYNNLTGLPLSLLAISENAKYIILEMGISEQLEMAKLASIARPNIMLFTGVYHSHLSNFNNYLDLVKEKLTALDYLKDYAIIKADLKNYLDEFYPKINYKVISEEFINQDLRLLLGEGPYLSYCLAYQVAKLLGVDEALLNQRSLNIKPYPLRMERKKINQQEWIFDCYNSSPESLRAFLKSLKNEKPGLLVLADMLELGQDSLTYHKEILKEVALMKGWQIALLGENFALANQHYNFRHFNSKADIKALIDREKPIKIALKGSRYFALETLCLAS